MQGSERERNDYTNMSYSEVEDALKSLIYLKGEIVVLQSVTHVTKIDIVMKKQILFKVFHKMHLLERGADVSLFEIIIGNKYGSSKHSFNLDDLNDLLVFYAHSFFP
jgi:hypothetical protein